MRAWPIISTRTHTYVTSMNGVQRRDELDAMEDDEEVAELDRKKAGDLSVMRASKL